MSLTTKSRYSLAENSLKTCEDLVTELMRQDDAWPFLKPVTKKEVIVLQLKTYAEHKLEEYTVVIASCYQYISVKMLVLYINDINVDVMSAVYFTHICQLLCCHLFVFQFAVIGAIATCVLYRCEHIFLCEVLLLIDW